MDNTQKINSYLQHNLPCFNREKLTKEELTTWNCIQESFAKYKVRSMYYQTLITLVGLSKETDLQKLIEKDYIKEMASMKGETILTISIYK